MTDSLRGPTNYSTGPTQKAAQAGEFKRDVKAQYQLSIDSGL